MADILDHMADAEAYAAELQGIDDGDSSEFAKQIMEREDGQLSEVKARELTDAIRSAATATYILLARAHEYKAWKALGYDTWKDYVSAEFDMSASRSYQLLNYYRDMEQIEASTPEGTEIKLTEWQARTLRDELPTITEKIREKTEGETPERATAIVNEIIDEAKEQKKIEDDAVASKQKSIDEAHEEGRREGLEAAADSLLGMDSPENMGDDADGSLVEVQVQGDGTSFTPDQAAAVHNFFQMINAAGTLPDPDDIIDLIPQEREDEVEELASDASSWLNRFLVLFEARDM